MKSPAPKPAPPSSKPASASALAEHWGVSRRTIYSWRSAGVKVDDDAAVAAWYHALHGPQQRGCTRRFRRKLAELRQGQGATPAGATDADYKTFSASYKVEGGDQNVLAALKMQLAFFLTKHRGASERNDQADAGDALRQIKELSGVIHDFEIRQQRLGRDLGDLVPRSELENVARFIGLNLLRCADGAISEIIKGLTERDPTLPPPTAEEIRTLVEPLLLTAVVFQPIDRAAKGTNGAAPPAFLVAALKEGLAEVVEE